MGTLLDFSAATWRRKPNRLPQSRSTAEIVVLPGIRMERPTVDLGARIRKVAKEPGGTVRPEA